MEVIKNKRNTVYRETIRIDGVKVKSPSFTRKSDAKAWKAKKVSELNEAKLFGDKKHTYRRIRFSEYTKNWLEQKIRVQKTKSTYANYERMLRLHFLPFLKDLYLDQITTTHVDQIIEHLKIKGHNNNGINKIIQNLKSILLDAEKADIIRKSPLRNYSSLKVIKRPPTFWKKSEITQFLKATRGHRLYPLFVMALNTGMRRGELAGLCWDKIDFSRRIIEVSRIRDRYGHRETTKTGISRHIPINDTLFNILDNMYEDRINEFVFTKYDGALINPHHIYRDFKLAQQRAGMENQIRFHDLRHCFASHFMMNGGKLYDLQQILGHTQTEMTQIYAHLSPDHLAQTTQIISFE